MGRIVFPIAVALTLPVLGKREVKRAVGIS